MWRTNLRSAAAYLAGVVLGALLTTAALTMVEAQAQTPAPPAPAALSEVDRLKAENLRLRFALLQQQEQQLREAAQKLEAERVTLEAAFRTALRAAPDATFNWQTLQFDGTATAAAPPPRGPGPSGAPAPSNGGSVPPER